VKKDNKYYYFLFILTTVISLILDISSKFIVLAHLPQGNSLEIIPNFFSLTLGFNYGAALGIMSGMQWLFITIFFVLTVAIYKFKEKLIGSKPLCIGFGLVLGGALGNIADRLAIQPYGAVTDFLDFYIKNYNKLLSYPTFNLADSCIVIGVVLILIFFTRTNSYN